MADELQNRIRSVETEVKELRTDLQRVEAKLDRLITSLTGDNISEGALRSLNKRISEQEKDMNNLSKSIVTLTKLSLTSDEHKAIKDILSIFKGWRLILGLAIWLIPLITLIIEKVFP